MAKIKRSLADKLLDEIYLATASLNDGEYCNTLEEIIEQLKISVEVKRGEMENPD